MSTSFVGVLVLGSAVNAWLVPALIVLLLAVAIWIGLRWIRSEHLDALASIPLFSHLPRGRLMSILRSTRSVEFPPGATIVSEGETGKAFYVITKGTAQVSVAGIDRASLTWGAYFGEVAVIDGGPRSATITAVTRMSTLGLTPAAFRKLLDDDPMIAGAVAEELQAKLARGGATHPTGVTRADRAMLEDLCRQLRATENTDWAQGTPVQTRGVRRLFART